MSFRFRFDRTAQIVMALAFALAQSAMAATPKIDHAIERQLALPEEKIDVGVAALTFAKEIYPDVDIGMYSTKIDELAAGAKQFIDRYGRHDPDSIIRALNSYYYKVYGVRYDRSAAGRARQENYL